jgi:glycosyltransferase involved in cell wall biosynthesis
MKAGITPTEISLDRKTQMSESIDYPSISVIVPSYNQGQYIEETLVSIIDQKYPNLEILVLDGGSTDDTVEVLKKYERHLYYWHSKADRGQADAINHGMKLSSGEIVCWLNSDDMYLPGALLDIGQRLRGRTDQYHLIYGKTNLVKQVGQKYHAFGCQTACPFNQFMLTYEDFISQPSSFWTRPLWQTVGELNIDYNYLLDWDWYIRASQVTQFEYVPQPYSIYRYHAAHKTSNGGETRRKEVRQIVSQYSSEYWSNLYVEVENYYASLKIWARLVSKLKVPPHLSHLLLKSLFPDLIQKVQDSQHVFTVMAMYG